ncbi:MAG: hypothetical protein ACKOA5_15075 [Actinomycetota bacterium]
MFGRKTKKARKTVVHTAECAAIHEAMLMSLYLGYGAPSAPLFIPSGGLVCTCDDQGGDTASESPAPPIGETQAPLQRTLIAV